MPTGYGWLFSSASWCWSSNRFTGYGSGGLCSCAVSLSVSLYFSPRCNAVSFCYNAGSLCFSHRYNAFSFCVIHRYNALSFCASPRFCFSVSSRGVEVPLVQELQLLAKDPLFSK